ncbi:heat-inducible transcriptional repressor HrcA [Temperatibacter marinus]|uniref:Heat-inducible transcription repressor HrcA n=1 Tax=Temperatibacter marinus TaxID=1456591 RepID=A0AA52H9X5_9PROT|nr:heat-inducible transcriptional repressor HrcA [Temperatibacter marinus]WND03651.1 heat-inducible transcriptional repressor HrcA [Temperatibacter marinus]
MKLSELNDRSQFIFRHIVESYLDTGDPVGSRTLSKADGISVSPATVRNVMADLEEVGLLMSPHTSAGRIPTESGLRLFVDGLMQVGGLTEEERESIKGQCNATGQSFDATLSDATKALAGLSNCASMVMAPKEDDLLIRHIEFVPLGSGQALVVLVGEDGSVENRIINLPLGLPAPALVQAGNYMSARLAGKTLDQAKRQINQELIQRQQEIDTLTATVIEKGLAVLSENTSGEPMLIVSGTSHLLKDDESIENMDRLKLLFDELENKKELVNLLSAAQTGAGTRIFIGSESNLFSLSGSSLVISPYMNGANKIVGVVGVIGPTRLNYARIIPMVDYTAKVITKML